jgi:predicted nuclease of predicted toxin-antitoxin system
MKIKLDENPGRRGADLFEAAGHDTSTVPQEGMSSAPDTEVIETCRRESRCLVTLDLEFGNPLLFRPSDYAGIAVLRLPPRSTPDDLLDGVRTLIRAMDDREIRGRLWVIQRGRVREYQEE